MWRERRARLGEREDPGTDRWSLRRRKIVLEPLVDEVRDVRPDLGELGEPPAALMYDRRFFGPAPDRGVRGAPECALSPVGVGRGGLAREQLGDVAVRERHGARALRREELVHPPVALLH